MLTSKLKKNYEELRQEATTSKAFLFLFLCVTIVLVGLLMTKKTIVTVVPWTLTGEAQVMSNDASQSYKEAWAMAISMLVGNVQPANVTFVAERLKPILSPEIYHSTIDAVHANAQQLQQERISLRFEPRQIVYEKSTDKLFVFGYSFARLGTSLETERRSERTYEMQLKISEYAPMLQYITTYTGRPLTKDVIERMEKGKQKEIERERREAERLGIRYSPRKEELKE